MSFLGSFAYLLRDEQGVSSVEYAFLLAVVSLAAVLAFTRHSQEVQNVVNITGDKMQDASGIGCSTG